MKNDQSSSESDISSQNLNTESVQNEPSSAIESEMAATSKASLSSDKVDDHKKEEIANQLIEDTPTTPIETRSTLKVDKDIVRKRERSQVRRRPKAIAQINKRHTFQKPVNPITRTVKVSESMTVRSLAQHMAVKTDEIVKKLSSSGEMRDVSADTLLDQDMVILLIEEFGHIPLNSTSPSIEDTVTAQDFKNGELTSRAPVVTVMGHVDHGKTTLLDYLRKTRVAASEAGGITQHIGAYCVSTGKGDITFLDTPGHALFTDMRARGTKATDIVILVVAADDGVMPQTEEAISHSKAADVPIIVAINKVDKPEANIEQTKQALSTQGVSPEEWGGEHIFVPISAKTGQGIENLLDAIHLQSEILELQTYEEGNARGVVIEAHMSLGKGPIITGLVQQGKLQKGDVILCDATYGKVRRLYDDLGASITHASPSQAVEIQGLSELPAVGTSFFVVDSERQAREIATTRSEKARANMLENKKPKREYEDLEDIYGDSAQHKIKHLNLIIKADVQGSREALYQAMLKMSSEKVEIRIVHSGVGSPTESDVALAQASDSTILTFNVRPDAKSRKLIEAKQIKLIMHSIVYEAVEEVERILNGLLDPIIEEKIKGVAQVKEVFRVSKIGNVAGCLVSEGEMRSQGTIRVVRDGTVIYTGDISSLKHFKQNTDHVKSGSECGLSIAKFQDIKVGDVLEMIEVTEQAQQI